jgi:hypothetical protein
MASFRGGRWPNYNSHRNQRSTVAGSVRESGSGSWASGISRATWRAVYAAEVPKVRSSGKRVSPKPAIPGKRYRRYIGSFSAALYLRWSGSTRRRTRRERARNVHGYRVHCRCNPGQIRWWSTHRVLHTHDGHGPRRSIDDAFRSATVNMAQWLTNSYDLIPAEAGPAMQKTAQHVEQVPAAGSRRQPSSQLRFPFHTSAAASGNVRFRVAFRSPAPTKQFTRHTRDCTCLRSHAEANTASYRVAGAGVAREPGDTRRR